MPPGSGIFSPPGASQVLPPSLERWMTCPNQPLVCDAYSRFGSTGDPLMWYSSQPAKCGPLTSQRSRLPSDSRMNAPLRVPTKTLTLLILILSTRAAGGAIVSMIELAKRSTRRRKNYRATMFAMKIALGSDHAGFELKERKKKKKHRPRGAGEGRGAQTPTPHAPH